MKRGPAPRPEAPARAGAQGDPPQAPGARETADPCLFCPSEAELAQLAGRDPALGRLMAALGPIARERQPDPFMALAHAIAGQQVSGAAHASVWRRLREAFPQFTPGRLAQAEPGELRACGLSLRKAGYIREIARRAHAGELDLDGLSALDDAALAAALCELPGVGLWTAEMLMIFCLGRKDVLSLGDFGIRKGLRMLYQKRELTPAFVARCKKRYAPLASVASLYLWALAGGAGGPDYTDPAALPKARRKAGAKQKARDRNSAPARAAAAGERTGRPVSRGRKQEKAG